MLSLERKHSIFVAQFRMTLYEAEVFNKVYSEAPKNIVSACYPELSHTLLIPLPRLGCRVKYGN